MTQTILPVALKRFAGVLLAASAGLAAIAAVLYVQDRRHERAITEQEGEHLVDFESEIVTHDFQQVRGDLLYLSGQQTLRRFLSGVEEARLPLEQEYIRFCLRKAIYDQVRCLDLEGKEIVRVNYHNGAPKAVPKEKLQEKTGRYYFQQALGLDEGQVLVSPFDLNVEHDVVERPIKPVIRFLTPALDRSGEHRGFLVLNYLGDHLLTKLAQASRRARGTSLLLNSRGDYLLAPRPEHAWGWMLGHERAFRTDYPLAWSRIRQDAGGQFFTGDRLFTYRRVGPPAQPLSDAAMASHNTSGNPAQDDGELHDAALVLVSHVPADVVYARSAALLRQLVLMYGGAVLVLVVLAWHWAHAAALRKAHEERIANSEARLRKLSSQLLTAQEEERRNISRQLHDELGQQVTAINLDLKSALVPTIPDRARDLLRRAVEGTEQLLKSLHEIATRVRPSVLDDLGLHDAIESYLQEYSRRTGTTVISELLLDREDMPAVIGENVYRILQEALANVAKHARTSQVFVTVKVDEHRILMSVRDEGAGFTPEQHTNSRLGILGMQERAELLDGSFHLSSSPGQGTRVDVTIPLSAE